MAVEKSDLAAKIEEFTVNRLTYEQFIEASCNTVFDEGTGEIISARVESEASLQPGEFYMTVDETINPDFQLSAYVTQVDFRQTVSSMINFRGVTYDTDWAAKLSSYGELSTADSPSDLYVHYDSQDPEAKNPDAPYEYPHHGDLVFYSRTGREFMYTQLSGSSPANTQFQMIQAAGYWSEIGNDWMLSVIKITTHQAVNYLSDQISSHINDKNNPHNVTAAQLNVYLCSQTSSAAELDVKFQSYYPTSDTSSKTELQTEFQKYYPISDTSSKTELQTEFQKYYLTSDTSSKTELAGALQGKLDVSLSVNAIADDTDSFRIPDVGAVKTYVADHSSGGGSGDRETFIIFDNSQVSSFDWVGELTQQSLADAGIYDLTENAWLMNPASIRVGWTVTDIGVSAFARSASLAAIQVGSAVVNIKDRAFYNCTSLTGVQMPEQMMTIGNSSFRGCSKLSNIVIPDNVVQIKGQAFRSCSKLADVTVGTGVTSIGDSAFDSCNALTSIVVKGKTQAEAETLLATAGVSPSIITTWNDVSQEWVAERYMLSSDIMDMMGDIEAILNSF